MPKYMVQVQETKIPHNQPSVVLEEAKLNWSIRLTQLSEEERQFFNNTWFTAKEERSLRETLMELRLKVYEKTLGDLVSQVGCTGMSPRLTNPSIRAKLDIHSASNAVSIANTYNYHLVGTILKMRKLNTQGEKFQFYREWREKRAQQKQLQVMTWTVNSTREAAASEFFLKNQGIAKGGTAVLRGPRPAKEPICRGWFKRGKVSLEEAVRNPPPYHLNCPHFWQYSLRRIPWWRRRVSCPRLWIGA